LAKGHKLSPEGKFLLKWGAQGAGDGQFTSPQGLAADKSGNVYVADPGRPHNYIHKFDAQGRFVAKWEKSKDPVRRQMHCPMDIASDAAGSLWVADEWDYAVLKYTPEGECLSRWSCWTGEYCTDARGMTVDAQGNVYVSSARNYIQKFDPEGKLVAQWGSGGDKDGQFDRPTGIAADGGGNLYVVDAFNNRIQKFDAGGKFVTKWGRKGTGDGEFDVATTASDIAVDAEGNVYVVDKNNHRVQKFDANGKFLLKWGTRGAEDGQFEWPHGVAASPEGVVYVSDTKNQRIQMFTAEGKFLGKWGSRGSGEGQMELRRDRGDPEDYACLSVDREGFVYLADVNNDRIQKFGPKGEFICAWGRLGGGPGEFCKPNKAAADAAGTVYVLDTENERVQKFRPVKAAK